MREKPRKREKERKERERKKKGKKERKEERGFRTIKKERKKERRDSFWKASCNDHQREKSTTIATSGFPTRENGTE